MNIKKIYPTLAILLCLLSVSPSYGQDIPTSVEPGIIMRDVEDTDRPRSRLEQTVPLEQRDLIPEGLSTEKMFVLNSVIIDDSTVYSQDAVNEEIKTYLGQQTSFADLYAIAAAMTKKYRADGYIFSRVVLPPQEIDGGVVHLQAIEGRLTEVEVAGTFKDEAGLIKKLAKKIEKAGPTNSADLERYLLLIDDLPGIKARSLVQPSQTPGGGKLLITIEQDDVEGSLSIDNRGSGYLGQLRGTVVAAANSLFGYHDRTTVRGIKTKDTEELGFFDISHEQQLGTEGTRFKARYALTDTNPGKELKPLDVEGDSRLLDLEFLYPVMRSRQYNLNLIGGITGLNTESDILGIDVAEDRVRYFRAGGRFDFTDSLAGVNQIDLEIAKGVDIFNATDDGLGRSRANGEHSFVRVNFAATRIQSIWGNFSAQISTAGQYSPDTLLSSEEFAVGGAEYGRAYDAGEITGDRGLTGALELRYSDAPDNQFLKSYQLYTYYDAGKVWNYNPAIGESAKESLASAGVGVRFNLNYDMSGYLEFDKPLTRDVSAEGNEDSRVFFSVLKRF